VLGFRSLGSNRKVAGAAIVLAAIEIIFTATWTVVSLVN